MCDECYVYVECIFYVKCVCGSILFFYFVEGCVHLLNMIQLFATLAFMFHSYSAYFNVLMYFEIPCPFSLFTCYVLCFVIQFVCSMFPSPIFHVHVLPTLVCTNDKFMGFFVFCKLARRLIKHNIYNQKS
jgi:hypothetical protein